jgi:hypothetical protein
MSPTLSEAASRIEAALSQTCQVLSHIPSPMVCVCGCIFFFFFLFRGGGGWVLRVHDRMYGVLCIIFLKVDHLLLHCDVAFTLWNHVFSRFDMSWVMPRRVVDLFACWWKVGRSRSAAAWKMVPICILWCVWKERNLRCFKDLKNSMENIVASFLHMLYLWTKAFLSPVSISFSDFLVRFSLPS